MPVDQTSEWFETVEVSNRIIRHASKFLRRDFTVSAETLRTDWPTWSSEQRLQFASAFAARGQLDANDQVVLDFLIDNGNPQIWTTIAMLLPMYVGRERAIQFLLDRVNAREFPLANYYQALEMMPDEKSVPILKQALMWHDIDLEQHQRLASWGDRFRYLDYLSCCLALLKITRKEEYRSNILHMARHPDEEIRKMAQRIGSDFIEK